MTDAIQELKVRAEILHGRVRAHDRRALARLRALPRLRRSSDEELVAAANAVPRRECLAVIAVELGFASWPEAKRALTGDGEVAGFGTLLCPRKCGGHFNLWYARYPEAAAVREARGGYLLAYRRHYFVVDRLYVETLGLDPDDPDWRRLGFDWVRPKDRGARARLYAQLVAGLPREAA